MNSEVIFDLDEQEKELENIEKTMAQATFWQKDQDELSRINQKRVAMKEIIDQWKRFYRETQDSKLLAEMALEEGDHDTIQEVEKDLSRISQEIRKLEFHLLFSDPDDKRNAIVAINAGAGGTEAQDWVQMLLRMYTRWCESKNFALSVIDYLEGDEAGIKNVTLTVT